MHNIIDKNHIQLHLRQGVYCKHDVGLYRKTLYNAYLHTNSNFRCNDSSLDISSYISADEET